MRSPGASGTVLVLGNVFTLFSVVHYGYNRVHSFMQKTLTSWLYPLLIALCMGLLSVPRANAVPLVIAQVSDRPKKDFKQLRPMVDYMASRMADLGFDRGEVRLFPSVDALIEAIQKGQVHWITETPYTAARLIREAKARAIVKKLKNGQREYQTLIYVRADSPFHTLADLVNQRIAFEHTASFSSYFLPRQIITSQGLNLIELDHHSDPVPQGRIGYLFSRNEKNNVLWVDKGLVQAGALNNGDWQNPERVPTSVREHLRVIHRSALYPRAFELTTPALSDAAAQRLQDTLLAMGSPQRSLLLRYEDTEGFEPVGPRDHLFLEQLLSEGARP
ncbi:MAG: hypothetical protein CMI01_09225 [Oceanospirillaceae bacterium]|nr:hypothetical protein [Oceanospirillaceae bacterium]